MAFVGMFLGGSPGALIPAGFAQLNLQFQTIHQAGTSGASFHVTAPGYDQTIPGADDGRAYATVPIGAVTVALTKGDISQTQTFTAEGQKSYLVLFTDEVDLNAYLLKSDFQLGPSAVRLHKTR